MSSPDHNMEDDEEAEVITNLKTRKRKRRTIMGIDDDRKEDIKAEDVNPAQDDQNVSTSTSYRHAAAEKRAAANLKRVGVMPQLILQ
jgi:hypothetical protein